MGAKNDLWTPERVQYLRDHYKTQWTRDIVVSLGNVFTRNAIIGKARRLGLQADFRLMPFRETSGKIVVKHHKVSPRGKPMEEIKTKVLSRPVKPVAITDLLEWHCREIVQDKPVRYCGMHKMEGSSYCPEHHRKNHQYVSHMKVEKYYGL